MLDEDVACLDLDHAVRFDQDVLAVSTQVGPTDRGRKRAARAKALHDVPVGAAGRHLTGRARVDGFRVDARTAAPSSRAREIRHHFGLQNAPEPNLHLLDDVGATHGFASRRSKQQWEVFGSAGSIIASVIAESPPRSPSGSSDRSRPCRRPLPLAASPARSPRPRGPSPDRARRDCRRRPLPTSA